MRVSLKKRGAVIFWDSVLLPKSNKFRAVFTALFVNIDLKFVFNTEGFIFTSKILVKGLCSAFTSEGTKMTQLYSYWAAFKKCLVMLSGAVRETENM